MATTLEAVPPVQGTDWYHLTAEEVCSRLDVDPLVGLSAAEVTSRRSQFGPNRLAEEANEPARKAFLRQYRTGLLRRFHRTAI